MHMTEVRLSSCGGVSGEVGASSDATVRPRGSRELWCCPGEKVFSVGVVSRRQTQLAHPRTAALTAAHQRVGGGNPSGGRDGGSAGMWTAGCGGSAKHASHTAQRPAVATMAELLEFLSARMDEGRLHAALSLLLPLLRPGNAPTADAARAVLDHVDLQRAAGQLIPPPLAEVEALLRQHSATWGAAAAATTTAAGPPAAGTNAPCSPKAGPISAISLAELGRPRHPPQTPNP